LAQVKLLHESGAKQVILSDSNSVFIKCVLDEHDMYGYFEEVITNPAFFDDDGRVPLA
jgi:hypothetical protein